jgi:hypothetical protein
MKKYINLGNILCSLFIVHCSLFFGCGEELMQYDINTQTPIVESYLEEGSNNLTVKLYSMEVYLHDEYILSNPVTNQILKVNGKALTETGAGTYSLALGEDTIREQQEFNLQFDYQGKTVKASTIVPRPITKLSIEPESIERTSSYYWYGSDTTQITLRWEDPDNSFYQVYIEPPTTTSTPSFGGGFPGRRMMQPFQGNSYQMTLREFSDSGNYFIYVYRVNKDYVELYERISSTDLANPVSFVENAFGVFTSISGAKVKFSVVNTSE